MGDPQKMSYIAGEAMTAPRGLPVKVSAARTVVLCDSGASGEESIGVIDQDTDVANGGELTVAVLGTPRQYQGRRRHHRGDAPLPDDRDRDRPGHPGDQRQRGLRLLLRPAGRGGRRPRLRDPVPLLGPLTD